MAKPKKPQFAKKNDFAQAMAKHITPAKGGKTMNRKTRKGGKGGKGC